MERGFNFDASARWETPRFRGEIAGFSNRIDNFIYLTPTSALAQDLRVFRYLQADARMTGGEISAEARVAEPITIRARHDFVHGTNEDTDEPLPLIPPARTAGGIDFRASPSWATSFFVGGEVEYVAKQTRPNPQDFVTDSYTLVNMDVGVERNFLGRATRMEVGVRNLGDVRYKNFLSRYKEFALEPGRNIIIRISTER